MIYIKETGILAVGAIRANLLQGFPLEQNKAIDKEGRASNDYRVDLNTSIFIVRWMDSCAACFKFRCIKPMETLNRWVNHGREKKDIACPKIVMLYNNSMGGVDLTDMLIAVYRIKGKKFFMMFRKVIEMLENVFS